MKKLLIGTAAFALLALVGAGSYANFCVNQTPVVDAADSVEETHRLYVAINTSTVESASYTEFNLRVNSNIGDGGTWRQTTMTPTTDTTTYSGKTVFVGTYTEKYGGVDALQIQIYDGDDWKEQVVVVNEWDPTDRTNQLFKYEESEWVAGYEPPTPLTFYTVRKLAVEFVDGVAGEPQDWSLGTDNPLGGSTYAIPAAIRKNYERFDGWFTDPACTAPFVGEPVNYSFVIYAKYTRLTEDSYFYWTSKDSTDMTNIYFFEEYSPVAWPGAALSTYKVSETLSFHNQGALYRIPVPSSGVIKAVINNGDGGDSKTIDMSITAGSFYYTYKDHESDGINYYGYAGNADAAEAADLVCDVETARNAVTKDGGAVADYSICGIDPAVAGDLYDTYYDMSSDVKSYVDDSNVTTYTDKDPSKGEGTIYYSAIMAQLKANAKNAGVGVKGVSYVVNMNESNNPFLFGTILAVGTGIGLASALILRRRRAE